ncbi:MULTISPECIES: hypothetical protein [Mesorhizobium]|uniref:hypothetical protein n=1 Tax=Mesorhizobium TaxID=68287 RepID=UPI0019CF7ED0|nr:MULTISPECIES: hypothetical protein [Mesorhizobium]MCF6125026.1 hypothetical protein [Mesorhizobium ciceri]MCQ8813553.1 hypothetical protein [Mesorhizobium sp. SEMIA396]
MKTVLDHIVAELPESQGSLSRQPRPKGLAPIFHQAHEWHKKPHRTPPYGEVLGAAKRYPPSASVLAFRLPNNERGACRAPALDCFGTAPGEGRRDYFLPAFAGAAFGLAAGAAFFTGAEDFAAAAFFAGAAFAAGFLAGAALAGAALAAGFFAGAAFFAAGFAAAFAAGFLAGAAFAAGFAAALAGAAFFTAGFAAAFAAGFLAGAAFALAAAAFGLAAGAAFFTAAATFAVAAFAGAFFAGAFDAGALDDCLAMRCPFRCADGRNDPARSCISDSRLASQRSNRLIFAT